MTTKQHNRLTKEQAIKLFESKFWERLSKYEIALFQLINKRLCVPFDVFHDALEKSLGRPVYTHEMALNWDGILKELLGEKPMPTQEEIINLIPEDKRILISV